MDNPLGGNQNLVELDQNKFEKFLEEFGSKSSELQVDIAKDYGGKIIDLYFKSLDFLYKIVTIVGLVAGFGFTAMSNVDNTFIFLTGEFLLLSSIGLSIYRIKEVYITERLSLIKQYKDVREHFKSRNEMFNKIFNDIFNTKKFLENDLKALLKKDAELVDVFDKYKNEEYWKNDEKKDGIKRMIDQTLFLFLTGTVLLLLSFIWSNFVSFICSIC